MSPAIATSSTCILHPRLLSSTGYHERAPRRKPGASAYTLTCLPLMGSYDVASSTCQALESGQLLGPREASLVLLSRSRGG